MKGRKWGKLPVPTVFVQTATASVRVYARARMRESSGGNVTPLSTDYFRPRFIFILRFLTALSRFYARRLTKPAVTVAAAVAVRNSNRQPAAS